jgi:hypothetical protein
MASDLRRDRCFGTVTCVWLATYSFFGGFAIRPVVSHVATNVASSSRHTCESGSMAASDGLLPSVLPRLVVPFDSAEGDVGLRSFAASLLVLRGPVGVTISMCGSSDCVVGSHETC